MEFRIVVRNRFHLFDEQLLLLLLLVVVVLLYMQLLLPIGSSIKFDPTVLEFIGVERGDDRTGNKGFRGSILDDVDDVAVVVTGFCCTTCNLVVPFGDNR